VNRNARRPFIRTSICLSAIALIAFALAACGSEDEQSLTFTITEEGKQRRVAGPESAEAGTAEITLKNEAKGGNDLQLIRVEGDHSAQEVVEGLGKASSGKPFPDWFFAGGGIGGTKPGESDTATQILQPGTYYALSTEGRLDAKSVAAIEVSGEESDDELPEADATVTAVEYGFDAEELPSGAVEIDFENDGVQPHHLLASRLLGDSTVADVERFFKTEKGKPPLRKEGEATAVIEGGEGQTVTFDLEPGRYAFYCFISDRQGGPPHAFKGMIDEVEVK
jgi:plastocyanin